MNVVFLNSRLFLCLLPAMKYMALARQSATMKMKITLKSDHCLRSFCLRWYVSELCFAKDKSCVYFRSIGKTSKFIASPLCVNICFVRQIQDIDFFAKHLCTGTIKAAQKRIEKREPDVAKQCKAKWATPNDCFHLLVSFCFIAPFLRVSFSLHISVHFRWARRGRNFRCVHVPRPVFNWPTNGKIVQKRRRMPDFTISF